MNNADLPLPLKHRQYGFYDNVARRHLTLQARRGRPMTIAAGFVVHDGIVLCADMLHGDGETNEIRPKILVWTGKKAAVVFALAGNSDVARAAIDRCCDVLDHAKVTQLSLGLIRQLLGKQILLSYRAALSAMPASMSDAMWFELLVAIDTAVDAPTLLAARPVLCTIDLFDCIGGGRTFGRHLAEQVYRRDMSLHEVTVLGIQILAEAKQRIPNIGGRSQFVSLVNKRVSEILAHDVNRSEPLVLEYRRRTSMLLMDAANHDLPDARFEDEVSRFVHFVRETRTDWLTLSQPWRELMRSLSLPHRAMRSAQKGSRRGWKRQLPLPA
jgi:20S proteasome alpha/beta subunit